jgi:hypothetical protein
MNVKHLVIGSGGLAAFIQYGIVRTLSEKNIINIDDIKTIYSCSCGSIVGTIMTLGYDYSWVTDYILGRPWHKHIPHIDPFSLFSDSPPKGLYDRSLFTIIFGPLFEAKGISIDVTLKEMYDVTGIKVVYMTTNLNDDIFEEYSLSYLTHPDWKVIDAIHASCAIPPAISPYEIDGGCYIDGGVVCQFPYDKCINNEKCEHSEVLGIYTKMIDCKLEPENNILDLFRVIVFKSWKTLNKDSLIDESQGNIISIDLGEDGRLSRIQTLMDSEPDRRKLIQRGVEYATSFISGLNR